MSARMHKVPLLLLAILSLHLSACTRSKYRAAADRQSVQLISSRNTDYRWSMPSRPVEPALDSRMSIPANLDCAPKPPDDPAAQPLMYCPDGHKNEKYWKKIPDAQSIESPRWLDSLPRQADGSVRLDQQTAIDLALLHSRDYQSQYESVYLTALSLTGNEFEFQTQWNGGTGTQYTATGKDLGNNKLLQVSDRLGFNRNLAGGGQLATNVLNSFFWDFGNNSLGSNGLLVTTFTQPVLRGAFRHVRLENLTQAERNLLYQVRTFARFRRQMYADVSAGYLSLLTQKQSIRNAQSNIESLKTNLVEHQEMQNLKMVSQIQVDQIFQEYQNGRLTLLAAEQDLIAAQDDFKFQLGLPPYVPFEIDERLLQPFELVSPELESLNQEVEQLYFSLHKYTPTESMPFEFATQQQLYDSFEQYQQLYKRVAKALPAIKDEYDRWTDHLAQLKLKSLNETDQIDLLQQQELAKRVGKELRDLEGGLAKQDEIDGEVKKKIDAYSRGVPDSDKSEQQAVLPSDTDLNLGTEKTLGQELRPEVVAWQSLYSAISGPLRQDISNLYIYQTQIRLFLIDVPPLTVPQEVAVSYAHQNRLDQMNRQANVMDAFRKIEVAADALQSSLTLNGQVGLGTDPNKVNAFRLDSSANTYRAGLAFDGPLNRLNERNIYRATQIAYQQAARDYTAGKDIIANEVRSALRQIELRRLNFQIARQQLVAATRQVDQAQFNLRTATISSTNLTRDLLQSLQGLLSAKNNLIGNWVQYKALRIRIFAILELLYMDENGVWVNEDMDLGELQSLIGPSDYFLDFMQATSAAMNSANLANSANTNNSTDPIGQDNAGQADSTGQDNSAESTDPDSAQAPTK